jgi:hypothetical protein
VSLPVTHACLLCDQSIFLVADPESDLWFAAVLLAVGVAAAGPVLAFCVKAVERRKRRIEK